MWARLAAGHATPAAAGTPAQGAPPGARPRPRWAQGRQAAGTSPAAHHMPARLRATTDREHPAWSENNILSLLPGDQAALQAVMSGPTGAIIAQLECDRSCQRVRIVDASWACLAAGTRRPMRVHAHLPPAARWGTPQHSRARQGTAPATPPAQHRCISPGMLTDHHIMLGVH